MFSIHIVICVISK